MVVPDFTKYEVTEDILPHIYNFNVNAISEQSKSKQVDSRKYSELNPSSRHYHGFLSDPNARFEAAFFSFPFPFMNAESTQHVFPIELKPIICILRTKECLGRIPFVYFSAMNDK